MEKKKNVDKSSSQKKKELKLDSKVINLEENISRAKETISLLYEEVNIQINKLDSSEKLIEFEKGSENASTNLDSLDLSPKIEADIEE